MAGSYVDKSSVDDIRRRFDHDVERFSNLDIGQSSTIDAAYAMELIASTAAVMCPDAAALLDIGCGAGNYTLKVLEKLPDLDVTLVDLSQPMLDRAQQRIRPKTDASVTAIQGDIREVEFLEGAFDLILAAAVFHHLRQDVEWEAVFRRCHRWLRPGGGIFIFDLVEHTHEGVQSLLWDRYGTYLNGLKGTEYRDYVFAYIQKEDTPRSLYFQLDLLHRVGFHDMDVLHKNVCFAAFYAIR